MLRVPTDFQGLREVSLFSGAGGGVLASKLLGWETIAYVEFGKLPQKILRARIADGLIHDAPVFGDVREFDGNQFKGKADIVSGGFPCFVADTMVLTSEGYRTIDEVRKGDLVLTHMGRWRPVTAIMVKADAPVREIKAQGVPGVVCTDEHPFYARFREWVWDNGRRRYVRRFGDPEWIDASELVVNVPGTLTSKIKSHFVGQVLPPERPDEHTVAFWWLIGRYLADGWRVKRKDRPEGNGRVVISCNHNEADELKIRIEAAGYHATRSKERTATKFHIVQNALYQMTEAFGYLAHGKHLNERVFSLPADKAQALCDGYFTGDGCRTANSRGEGTHLSCSTVSKALALGIALLAQRAYGVVASVRLVPTEDTKIIEGRVVNQRDFYRVVISDQNRSAIIEGSHGWKNVRSNLPKGRATVFNIAVEEDESYVADGAIVHNCQPFSVAGKRLAVDDERNMWPETARIISEVQPKFAFLENVPGLLSASHGYFGTILSDLADIGYECIWDCVPASAVGAPHLRNRLWILARPATLRDPATREVIPAFATRKDDKTWNNLGRVGEEGADWSRCGALLLYDDDSILAHRTPRMAFPEDKKSRYGVWPWPSLLMGDPMPDVDEHDREMWMTPNTFDGITPKSQAALDHEAEHRKGRANPNNLRDQVNVEEGNAVWKGMWPTPRTAQASMYAEDAKTLAARGRDGSDSLANAVVAAATRDMYPTPRANDWKGPDLARDENRSGARHGGDDLATRVEKERRDMWATPLAGCSRKSVRAMLSSKGKGRHFDGGQSSPPELEQQVGLAEGIIPKELGGISPEDLPDATREMFPTPTAADGKRGPDFARATRKGSGGDDLVSRVSREDRQFPTPRKGTKDHNNPTLNPDWVESLMGWPRGWTNLNPLSCVEFESWVAGMTSHNPTVDYGPAAWENGSWENAVPRLTTEKTNRGARLKALGNGQVSLCAAAACVGLHETFLQMEEKLKRETDGYKMGIDEFFDL